MNPGELISEVHKVEEGEVDERWSVVGKKTPQRWLWHAMGHRTGGVVAYVLGTHQADVFIQLKAL
jgi:IS1 family transposase